MKIWWHLAKSVFLLLFFSFFLLPLCSELLVIPWLRTSAVFTCSCRRRASIATTSLEKYGSRALQKWDLGRALLSPVLIFYPHSSAKCRVTFIFAPSKARCIVKQCRTWTYWPDDLCTCLRVSLYTHGVFVLHHCTSWRVGGCVHYYMIIPERCSTKQRWLAHFFVLSGRCLGQY